MTEPHAGSDLKAIRTRAVRDGDDFVINGQKVFISNGQMCDVLVLATKTDSAAGAKGVTLFLVDTSLPGFKRGKNLDKLGMKAQDTSELFFDDLRVPASAMLGEEGEGLRADDDQAGAGAPGAGDPLGHGGRDGHRLDGRLHRQRKAFGKTIADFQNTQFKLADLKARGHRRPRLHRQAASSCSWQGKLDPVDAAMAKM
jgi:acyl-CoA dehydrogenase